MTKRATGLEGPAGSCHKGVDGLNEQAQYHAGKHRTVPLFDYANPGDRKENEKYTNDLYEVRGGKIAKFRLINPHDDSQDVG